jgi:hypothetical protein
MVEEPTQDLNVLFKAMKEEEQVDSKEHEDYENHNDHENEEE